MRVKYKGLEYRVRWDGKVDVYTPHKDGYTVQTRVEDKELIKTIHELTKRK